jgi:hypothetical protein
MFAPTDRCQGRIIKTIRFDGIDCTDGCVDAHDPPFRSPRSEEFISQTCEHNKNSWPHFPQKVSDQSQRTVIAVSAKIPILGSADGNKNQRLHGYLRQEIWITS